MNDLQRIPKRPYTEYAEAGDPGWGTKPAGPPAGLEEAAAFFEHRPQPVPAPVLPLRRPQMIGVRLNRAGASDLIIPDVAALPRALRDRSVKRAVDLMLAIVLLCLLAVPMILIAAVLLPGGGALFVQPRVGRNRSRFGCLKFRTMRPDAEARLEALLSTNPQARADWQSHQKLRQDPRITWFGNVLRTASLDELPQLINVLRGEMSLVGPRPIVAPEVGGYPSDRSYYHSPGFDDYAGCLPGITGLWQVAGRHGTAHAERVRLDRIYARNWSVLLDLKILWRTVRVVLSGSGG